MNAPTSRTAPGWPALFLEVEGHGDVEGRYWRYGAPAAWTYATGDLARRDEAGELEIIEIIRRLDPAVKVSGQLVSPTSPKCWPSTRWSGRLREAMAATEPF